MCRFNGKLHCSHRRYQYLLPTYLFKDHSVTNTELHETYSLQGPVKNAARKGGYAEPGSSCLLGHDSLAKTRTQFLSYRASESELEKLKSVLKVFEGTRSYHNYTSNKNPGDDSAMRFITSFQNSEPFVDEIHGGEWICLSISGQSFLLNQIRKMVNIILEFTRGRITLDQVHSTFSLTEKIDIPMVPGLGLYLDELFFDRYNLKLEQEEEKYKRSIINKANAEKSSKSNVSCGNI